LELVFSCLSKNNVRINKDKCEFLKESITYCGYEIEKNGISKEKQKNKGSKCLNLIILLN